MMVSKSNKIAAKSKKWATLTFIKYLGVTRIWIIFNYAFCVKVAIIMPTDPTNRMIIYPA